MSNGDLVDAYTVRDIKTLYFQFKETEKEKEKEKERASERE